MSDDIQTGHLLAAVRDALAVPYPGVPEARLAYLELARDRATGVRRAVDHATVTGDLSRATDMIDEAIADLPVTYPTDRLWSPTGIDAVASR